MKLFYAFVRTTKINLSLLKAYFRSFVHFTQSKL